MTGLLVIGTVAVVVATLILLGAPGLFRPLVTYRIYFDNASGIKLGAPVMLAGRKIGQVQKLYSPVSREEDQRAQEAAATIRPPESTPSPSPSNGKPKFEVRIDVQVDKSAVVYRDALTRMIQLGLLGELAIDITQGTAESGRARDGEMFAGERTPDFGEAVGKLLEVVQPVAAEATKTMKELESTAQNLSKLTDQGSELNQALERFKTFGDHLVDLTAPDGALTASLENIQAITDQLTENDNIKVTLQNFRDSSDKLKATMRDLEPVGRNVAEFSNTIKTQPWRLIWPGSKKSPEGSPTPAEQTITVRKSVKPKATPSQSGSR
ncbi:MAG: phospholipid/cholesterol/gamma-HCH transport system substrate-binding protein [Verrucomicrobiota bacterium]